MSPEIRVSKLKLPQKASSMNEELILLLKYGLPADVCTRWHKWSDVDTLLRRGGFPSLPAKFVLKAMKSNQNNNMFFGLNTFQNRIWYCFDYDNRVYDAPLAQTNILNSLSDAEKAKAVPVIPENYFIKFELDYLNEYMHDNNNQCTSSKTSNPASTTTQTKRASVSNSGDTEKTVNTALSKAPVSKLMVFIPPTSSRKRNKFRDVTPSLANKKRASNISMVPTKQSVGATCLSTGTPLSTGIVLMDLDGLDQFQTNVVEKHARSCPAGSLIVVKQVKEGYDLDRTYYCRFCKKSFSMSTGPKPETKSGLRKKRGRQMRPINKMMSNAILKSGAPANQVQEIFSETGAISPSKTGLAKMVD